MLPTVDQNTLFLLTIFLLIVTASLILYAIRNEYRIKKLLKGNQISDLEKYLIKSETDLKDLKKFRAETEKVIETMLARIKAGARDIGVVRFNPFGKKGGGNQSFSTAFVNENGDGVVFSALHVRDHTTLFAKPLTSNKSEHELSI